MQAEKWQDCKKYYKCTEVRNSKNPFSSQTDQQFLKEIGATSRLKNNTYIKRIERVDKTITKKKKTKSKKQEQKTKSTL